jgi:adenosylcobinamide-GDP ribazoletransferase
MHDPRAGSFGVVAVVLLLGLKVAALGSLSPELRPAALLLGPCFGRWSIVTVTSAFRYARPIGSGRAFKDAVRPIHTAVAGLIVFVAAALSAGWVGVVVAGLMTLVALVLGRWCSGRLGGLTGDTYGATCELVETTTWLIFGLHLAGMSPVAPWLAELLPPTRWSAMLALVAPGHGGFFG